MAPGTWDMAEGRGGLVAAARGLSPAALSKASAVAHTAVGWLLPETALCFPDEGNRTRLAYPAFALRPGRKTCSVHW